MQLSSEAYEAEDCCIRVTVARRLMLPHPAATNPSGVAPTCPNKSAAVPNRWMYNSTIAMVVGTEEVSTAADG